jgi:heme-degrading monooxygenase HmoA
LVVTQRKEDGKMAVKIIIKRVVPENKAEALKPLLQTLRNLAMQQPGYISGETFKRIDRPGESLVVSTWQSMEDWREWVVNDIRKGTQEKIDHLLGEKTKYEIYSYD